jgi:hypothetical protein
MPATFLHKAHQKAFFPKRGLIWLRQEGCTNPPALRYRAGHTLHVFGVFRVMNCLLGQTITRLKPFLLIDWPGRDAQLHVLGLKRVMNCAGRDEAGLGTRTPAKTGKNAGIQVPKDVNNRKNDQKCGNSRPTGVNLHSGPSLPRGEGFKTKGLSPILASEIGTSSISLGSGEGSGGGNVGGRAAVLRGKGAIAGETKSLPRGDLSF